MTDLSVVLADKSVATIDFVRCHKKIEVVDTIGTKSVMTTDFSVKATDKSVRRTVSGRLEHKPSFLLAHQILFFGEK
jgi:hypothetical protein